MSYGVKYSYGYGMFKSATWTKYFPHEKQAIGFVKHIEKKDGEAYYYYIKD